MNSTERYRSDPVYRANIIKNNKLYRQQNMKYPVFKKLCKCRNLMNACKDSITIHRKRITFFQNRMSQMRRKIEQLELEWGQLRARLKKENKEDRRNGARV